jgi:hypothetical protein
MNKIILIIIIFSGVISFYLGSFILPNYTEGIGNYLAPSSAKLQIDEQVLPSEESTTQDLEKRNFESNLTNEIDTIKKLEASQKTEQIDGNPNELQNSVRELETRRRQMLQNFDSQFESLSLEHNRELQRQRDQLVRADARGYQRGKQEILSKLKK